MSSQRSPSPESRGPRRLAVSQLERDRIIETALLSVRRVHNASSEVEASARTVLYLAFSWPQKSCEISILCPRLIDDFSASLSFSVWLKKRKKEKEENINSSSFFRFSFFLLNSVKDFFETEGLLVEDKLSGCFFSLSLSFCRFLQA